MYSGGERERIFRQMSGGGLYENQKDLQQHCTMVSETFFRSFVKCKPVTSQLQSIFLFTHMQYFAHVTKQ